MFQHCYLWKPLHVPPYKKIFDQLASMLSFCSKTKNHQSISSSVFNLITRLHQIFQQRTPQLIIWPKHIAVDITSSAPIAIETHLQDSADSG